MSARETPRRCKMQFAPAERVGEPREPGNLGKTIAGTILTAGPVAGAMAAGGPGSAVLGGLAHTLASGIEDPSFVRSVAGRGVTPEVLVRSVGVAHIRRQISPR